MAGAGNSNVAMNYSYTDAFPVSGMNYYRLSQTDFNGQRDTLGIVEASCGQMNASVSYFPNPFTSEVTVQMNNLTSSNAILTIFDAIGQLVYSRQLSSDDIERRIIVVDLNSLASGVYTVVFKSEDYLSTDKIVKE